MAHSTWLSIIVLAAGWLLYQLVSTIVTSPLRNVPGPDASRGLGIGGHLDGVLNSRKSKATVDEYVRKYGKNIRIKGLGNWEDRLLTTDPVAMAHVMNHTLDYEKPWQSRRLITKLIGEGMLAAEGQVHKRMRRVGTPAFSVQNMRALVPVVFGKARELKEKWAEMISANEKEMVAGDLKSDKDTAMGLRLDVCHWISRATFDVIGLAGFDYNFSAIQHEGNELFLAFKDMFEIAISRGSAFWSIAVIYAPWLEWIFPNEKTRIVRTSHETIYRVGGQLIDEKKKRIAEGERNGTDYAGIDLLSLLLKSNMSQDIPDAQRISDKDILHNVNTFLFAGSDTTSLALTWTLLLLAMHPEIQTRLRSELLELARTPEFISPPPPEDNAGWQTLWSALDALPYLNNVIRESLRVIPPVHSSIRVATRDDEIPTSEAVRMKDGTLKWGIKIRKGQFVHVPVESMNVDKGVWGEDAWSFVPDRWDDLPTAVLEQPGLYNHLLTFSAGPRSCIGMRMSIIEMKTFLFMLVSEFSFKTCERVVPMNVVLTRPYVAGKFMDGSQCPLLVSRIDGGR